MRIDVNNPIFGSHEQGGLDVNAFSKSQRFDVSGFPEVSVQVELETGTFENAVIQAQLSADGTNFHDLAGKIIVGPGILDEIPIGTEYFRVRVSRVEGSAGTAKITINAKR